MRAQPQPPAHPIFSYVLTDRRVIRHDFGVRATWALFLGEIQFELHRQNPRYGDIAFFPSPVTRKIESVFVFSRLVDAADVSQRITKAQKGYHGSTTNADLPLPSAVQATLLPGEQVLWSGNPDLADRQQRAERRELQLAVGVVLLFAVGFYLVLTWVGGGTFDLSSFIQLILMISVLPLMTVAVIVTVRRVRKRAAKNKPADPAPMPELYVLTDRRAFVYSFEYHSTLSILLEDAQTRLKLLGNDHGQVAFVPRIGYADPKGTVIPIVTAFSFADLPDAAEVHRLILAAQEQSKRS